MKREELIELNVPEEAIDKIMQINGADIEKAKAALEEKEKALTEAHENLEAGQQADRRVQRNGYREYPKSM